MKRGKSHTKSWDRSRSLGAAVASLLSAAVAGGQPLSVLTVDVDNPGNVGDTVVMADGTTGYGSVDYVFEIGVFEITNTEYAAFLNAVASSDPNGLFNPAMAETFNGGIARVGDEGSYVYMIRPGFENKPVVHVSFFDAARFANWLHNGQPSGPQNVNTTEAGAYMLLGPTSMAPGNIDGNGRHTGWLWAVPSEDEWHKAAYGNSADSYTFYATQSNVTPTATAPPGDSNSANYNGAVPLLTEGGAYDMSVSFWGTFDQNGNLMEYNEGDEGARRVRGGSWDTPQNALPSSERGFVSDATSESNEIGFRVVRAVVATNTGACCLAFGGCADGLTEANCTALGGTYAGDGTLCSTVPCSIPTGACCFSDGACLDGTAEIDCQNMNGLYQGDDVSCLDAMCHPVGPLLFVDASVPAGGDGSSWSEAMTEFQDALGLAAMYPGTVSQIWVATGSYRPDLGTGDREASFVLVDNVEVYGGFAGDEIDLMQRDVVNNSTILSGDLNGDDGPGFQNNGENSFHVVTATSLTPNVTLDGFTITSGNANGGDVNDSRRRGGGMLNSADNVIIANCRFVANDAIERGGGLMIAAVNASITNCQFIGNRVVVRGGGLSIQGQGSPIVSNCRFEQNEADFGAAVFSTGYAAPVFSECTFEANVAGRAGGIRVENSHPVVIACQFVNNVGQVGVGAIEVIDESTLTITDCAFSGNTPSALRATSSRISCRNTVFSNNTAGPAVQYSGAFGELSTFTHCTFADNVSPTDGGAFWVSSGDVELINCAFTGNSSGLRGGAIYLSQSAEARIHGCAFIANDAQNGGAIFDNFSGALVTNCTFSVNSATVSGGAVESAGASSALIVNCIVWNNTAPISAEVSGPASVAYSDVQGGHSGPGNIDADPSFTDPIGGDYHLLAGSPCIDSGNNWGVPVDRPDLDGDGDVLELAPLELDGNPRFADDPAAGDVGCGVPVVVDMGPYEFPGPSADPVRVADLDGDAMVTVVDLLGLLSAWGACPTTCCLADLDLDGSVGVADLLKLLANWG